MHGRNSAGKSKGVGKGVKVEPESWRSPRLWPSMEAAENKVWGEGGFSDPQQVSPSLEVFLLHLQRLVIQAEIPGKKWFCWEECSVRVTIRQLQASTNFHKLLSF